MTKTPSKASKIENLNLGQKSPFVPSEIIKTRIRPRQHQMLTLFKLLKLKNSNKTNLISWGIVPHIPASDKY